MTDTPEAEGQPLLNRTQKRLLRRVYNGRTVPIIVDGQPFLTYKAALGYLQTLSLAEQDAAYEAMKAFATTAKT